MDEIEAKNLSLELMEISKAAYLTTIDADGFPHTRGMTNMRNKHTHPHLIPLFRNHKEDFLIIFSTNTSSSKVSHVKMNPKVAVYYSHPEKTQGVMFGGEIEIVLDSELKRAIWRNEMVKYYPSGYNDPDHTILRLSPRIARGWNGQKFTTFAFNIRRFHMTQQRERGFFIAKIQVSGRIFAKILKEYCNFLRQVLVKRALPNKEFGKHCNKQRSGH